jgi:hypothetical protein
MSRQSMRLAGFVVVAATLFALFSASLGAGEARAGDCVMNFTFNLGIPNTCNAPTTLDSTGGLGIGVTNATPDGIALFGRASAVTGGGVGVFGQTDSSGAGARGVRGDLLSSTPGINSAGVVGFSASTTGNGPGVFGTHTTVSGTAPGVLGRTSSTDANAAGVYGTITSHADYSGGVRGENLDATCCGFGVVGFHAGQGIGIGGYAPNGFGVFGWSPNNWAAYFDGAVEVVHDLHVNGTVFKGAGAFRIDNPLDPAHSYLQHSFVESPQMMNVYNGNVATNAKGFATVKLPRWFQALNKDFRYQLTVLGSSFAQAIVAKEIHDNQFTIRTNKPKVKVSWQVTGVRHDPYANAHRIQVVVPKEGSAQGKYLHPQLYGQPQSKGETALPGLTRAMPKLKAPASAPLLKQP